MGLESGSQRIKSLGNTEQEREHAEEILLLVLVQQVLELLPNDLSVTLDKDRFALLDKGLVCARMKIHLNSGLLLCQAGFGLVNKRIWR